MGQKYILLNDHSIIEEPDFIKWAEWLQDAGENRIVKQEKVFSRWRYYFVSTVFLGINHRYDNNGPPLLFETMVFDNEESIYCYRYPTWAEAEKGHKHTVNCVKQCRWSPFGWKRD